MTCTGLTGLRKCFKKLTSAMQNRNELEYQIFIRTSKTKIRSKINIVTKYVWGKT